MSEPHAQPVADRNLLFGILALQMDFISRDALIAGMHAWVPGIRGEQGICRSAADEPGRRPGLRREASRCRQGRSPVRGEELYRPAAHRSPLASGNGWVVFYLGDAKTAAEQFQAAGTLFSQHRGTDHSDTLRASNNLAASYADLGRHADALKLREETLAIRKGKLGPDHPDTLISMNNLANSYYALGRLASEQADLAMDRLRKAVAAGYKNAAHMKKDNDLDPLRQREDFKQLLAEVEAKNAAKETPKK